MTVLPLLWLCAFAAPATADQSLERFIAQTDPGEVFPGATGFGSLIDAAPVAPLLRAGTTAGHVFLNSDFANAIGYSGKPVHVLVAMDNDGVIVGTKLVEHHEPIVLIGIPEQKITGILAHYGGLDAVALARGNEPDRQVDVVSGATVTVMVMDDSILNAATRVARLLGLGGLKPMRKKAARAALIRQDYLQVADWTDLLSEGAVRRLKLTVGDVNAAFSASGDAAAAARAEPGEADDLFVEVYVALVSVPSIGLSLLGEHEYRNLLNRLQPGQHALLVAGAGRYSFKGSGYVRGGIFDRFQIRQSDTAIRFRDLDHKRLRRIQAQGAPALKEVGLFRFPADSPFSAVEPWRFELLVGRATGPTSKAFLEFDLDYRVPDKYVEETAATTAGDVSAAPAEPEQTALWIKIWQRKWWQILVLMAALGVLTWIFFFQTWLVKRPALTDKVRLGFLLFTLIGIGWYANAQLSVVNILTVFNSLLTGFDWQFFLNEPLIFILWGSVAASLLFWGRGVYCGWLCPFGALQELINRVARKLKVKQVSVPWWLHERLWALKYIVFLVLFGVSLHSLSLAEQLAEIEPFKTAIILKFMRHWPFVLFAVAMLAAGVFIERFYCRYVCPLGAALAIPGKMRMFEWLKRYKQCGSPCQSCARECMVQAIHREGNINPNECLYCLNCQTLYHDDQRCFYLVQRNLKRRRRSATAPRPQLGKAISEIRRASN